MSHKKGKTMRKKNQQQTKQNTEISALECKVIFMDSKYSHHLKNTFTMAMIWIC